MFLADLLPGEGEDLSSLSGVLLEEEPVLIKSRLECFLS